MGENPGSTVANQLLKLVLGDPEKDDLDAEAKTQDEGLTDPFAGLPNHYGVTKSNYLVLYGPQVALSSEVDQDSTILFAMETASFKSYLVTDNDFVGDAVKSHVMHR